MALSQIQCLDENHVNWRINESKPEFFYSEDQRLALEALLQDGRDAFEAYIKTHKVREFLSEMELERVFRTAEIYNPGSDMKKEARGESAEDEEESLQYWPERSDSSIPALDMGWPDVTSYRGVTRVNVYTQPPMDGQMHIKEVVRKTIVQAQKVIAVVMDLFTDVDIFKDLLDASFKRKVAVYVILETSGLPHFLSMSERAGMHRGHLKNLRIRSIGGAEFYTRSSKKVCGTMSQKFMFVDGDRAVSGSYSFTWMASRLDRNLITVLTGQAVDTFDKLFRDLYLTSRSVNLSKVNLVDEPEPEPMPQLAPAPLPSAVVARKLINPKYALVTGGAGEAGSGASSDKHSAKNGSSTNPVMKVPQKVKEPLEPPPIHPGLLNLERVNMIPYLPTWPEPDPASDVIGFINIRDSNKPIQAHLMRSELFETSQAIRFKDPFVAPEESLPEKAHPRQNSGIMPNEEPSAQEQSLPQPQTQSAEDELQESEQPLDQTKQGEGSGPKEDIPVPPVPKRRTVHLKISHDSSDDSPNISIVEKPSTEPEMPTVPQIWVSDEDNETADTTDPPDDATTSVVLTPQCEVTPEVIDAKDEDDTQKHVRVIDATDETDGPKEPYAESFQNDLPVCATTDQYFESSYYDKLNLRLAVKGMHTGSGRMGDHRHVEGVNLMARFSQSMLDLRLDSQQQQEQREGGNEQALADIHTALQRNQRQPQKCGGRKLHLTSSRPPGDTLNADRQGKGRVMPKVILAKPGSYHRPAKAAGPVIGGHKYWQGKLFSQDRAVSGPRSPNRLGPGQLGIPRNGRSPSRQNSYRPEVGQVDLSKLGQSHGHSAPYGIALAKLSQFKHLKGKISEAALGNVQKKMQIGHKGAI